MAALARLPLPLWSRWKLESQVLCLWRHPRTRSCSYRHYCSSMSSPISAASPVEAQAQAEPGSGFRFGKYEIDPKEVFLTSCHSFALVNLRPVVPDVLICPRRVVARFADLRADEVCDLWLTAKLVGTKVEKHFNASSLTFAIQDGPQAGQTVAHVHVHVLPRTLGDFKENDEVYDALDAKEKELSKTLDIERKDRSVEEMAKEADELRGLF